VRSIRDIEDLGYLRSATRAAEMLRLPRNDEKREGRTDDELWKRFWGALRIIDDEIIAKLQEGQSHGLEFVIALYRAKTARAAAPSVAAAFDRLTVAEAVAASANFPPVLPSYRLTGFYDDRTVGTLGLTDGGVFENSGVQTLLDEHCNRIIVSDSSAPFRLRRRGAVGRVRLMYLITDSLTTGVSWRQQMRMMKLRDAGEIASYAWIDVDGPAREPKYAPQPLTLGLNGHAIARLRTDLDRFGDVEIAALVNHGYDRADRYLRKYVVDDSGLVGVRWSSPPEEPYRKDCLPEPDRLNAILRVGRWRFWRAIRLWSATWPRCSLAGAITALAVLLITALDGRVRDAAIGAVQLGAADAWAYVTDFARYHPTVWTLGTYHASLRTVSWAVFGVLSLRFVGSATVGHQLEHFGVGATSLRRLAMVGDRTGELWLNLLWLLGPLPVPVAALLIFVGAWTSMQLFGRLFHRATRLQLRPGRAAS
jgi:hypothetical protein